MPLAQEYRLLDGKNISTIIQKTLNYVDARLVDHGKRVSYLVMKMAEELECYSEDEIKEIAFLALLHDIGAYKTEEIDDMVNFETTNIWEHSIYGYLFIKYLSPISRWAPAVLFHHISYNQMDGTEECAQIAQIINIADRADVFLENDKSIDKLMQLLEDSRGSRFSDEAVDLFAAAQEKHNMIGAILSPGSLTPAFPTLELTRQSTTAFVKMLICIIDFRSRHTLTHTITTTVISKETASVMNLSEETTAKLTCGAMLHDLGKIGIPLEILEFSGKLSPQAMKIMRTHVDITEKILDDCLDDEIVQIALRHHEKLDGSGYPKGLTAKELKLSERILAVSDIVSALVGVRSYKGAFSKEKTLGIIQKMAQNGYIDPEVVQTITDHFDDIIKTVRKQSAPFTEVYEKINAEYQQLIEKYKTGHNPVISTAY